MQGLHILNGTDFWTQLSSALHRQRTPKADVGHAALRLLAFECLRQSHAPEQYSLVFQFAAAAANLHSTPQDARVFSQEKFSEAETDWNDLSLIDIGGYCGDRDWEWTKADALRILTDLELKPAPLAVSMRFVREHPSEMRKLRGSIVVLKRAPSNQTALFKNIAGKPTITREIVDTFGRHDRVVAGKRSHR